MNIYLVIIKNLVSFNVKDLFWSYNCLFLCLSFSIGFVLGANNLVLGPCLSVHCVWELRSLWWWGFRLWTTALWHQLILWVNTDFWRNLLPPVKIGLTRAGMGVLWLCRDSGRIRPRGRWNESQGLRRGGFFPPHFCTFLHFINHFAIWC